MAAEERSSWSLAEGDEVAPGLSVLDTLGGGRRFEVYLAFSERHWSTCAVKLMRPDKVGDEKAQAALAREAELLARLAHPVVVRGFDAVLDGERPHLMLEYLDGPHLSHLVRRYGTLQADQLVPLALSLAAALHYLHSEGVVHLDVKPSNVIMGAPPRLIDLSLARTVQEATKLDHHVGTDGYMAPEQRQPAELGPPGTPADVWGLGATLYDAIAGEPPGADPAPPPGDERLAELILDCLEAEPGDRPSAREVAEELEPVLDSLPKPGRRGRR
jgi:serine/threonine protein kinase